MELGSTVPENEEEGGMDGRSDPSSGCCMPRTQHQRYLPKVQSNEPLLTNHGGEGANQKPSLFLANNVNNHFQSLLPTDEAFKFLVWSQCSNIAKALLPTAPLISQLGDSDTPVTIDEKKKKTVDDNRAAKRAEHSRKAETPAKTCERLSKTGDFIKHVRKNQTEEEREERLSKDAEYKAHIRTNQTKEEKEKRLRKTAESLAHIRRNQTEEEQITAAKTRPHMQELADAEVNRILQRLRQRCLDNLADLHTLARENKRLRAQKRSLSFKLNMSQQEKIKKVEEVNLDACLDASVFEHDDMDDLMSSFET